MFQDYDKNKQNRRSLAEVPAVPKEVPPVPKPRESLALLSQLRGNQSLQSSPSHRAPLHRARVAENPTVLVAPIPSIRDENVLSILSSFLLTLNFLGKNWLLSGGILKVKLRNDCS